MSGRSGAAVSVRTWTVCFLAIGLAVVGYVAGASAATPLVVTPIGSDVLERLIVPNTEP